MFKSFLPGIFALGFCAAAAAQPPAADASLPPALKDWRAWVLKDLDYRACPFIATGMPNSPDAFLCAWPGRLSLNAARQRSAIFPCTGASKRAGWIPLPGDAEHWPQQVVVNGQRQPVVPHDGAPSLWLEPGSDEIGGRIAWSERPQSIHVPSRIGLIALTLDGKAIVPLQRNGDDLMLGRSAAATPQADSIDLRVYRKLSDGVPAELTTRLVLSVSGQAREEVIGPVLPEGFEPLALEWHLAGATRRRRPSACPGATRRRHLESERARDAGIDHAERASAGAAVGEAGNLELRGGAAPARDQREQCGAGRSASGRSAGRLECVAGIRARRWRQDRDRTTFARTRAGRRQSSDPAARSVAGFCRRWLVCARSHWWANGAGLALRCGRTVHAGTRERRDSAASLERLAKPCWSRTAQVRR